ncbi:ankyrin repeat-containing domain protein [Phaeosphaeria sp. MPI-PUGE-AT-0046c]|nr:ankyrin repeat-containing domain protein [Phaeosphaeria sp. MPI-PUGE-AT-0046c]
MTTKASTSLPWPATLAIPSSPARLLMNNTALHYAAFRGRASTARRLLESGANAGATNSRGQTALHIAIRVKRQDTLQCLLEFMSLDEINATDDMGESAVHIVCWQQESSDLAKMLLNAGCEATKQDLRGLTPLQISQKQNNIKVSELLAQSTAANSLESKDYQRSRGDVYSRYDADRDLKECHCQWCSVCTALKNAGEEFATRNSWCPCPNHVAIFAKDTLSSTYTVNACLRHCLCKACIRGRGHNAARPPCGVPIDRLYVPCNERKGQDTQTDHMSTDLSLGPLDLKRNGGPLPPYPGHQYYDDVIDDKSKVRTTNLSQEEIMAMVLSTLTDAGFRGSKSYGKHPDDAAKWVIDHYDADIHATKMVEILLDCGANVNVSSRGKGLLAIAAEKGDLALTKLLLDKQVIIDPTDAMPSSELRATVNRLRSRFVNARADIGPSNALRAALLHRQTLSCRMLLKAGANINRLDRQEGNNTLLHTAITRYDKLGGYIPFLLAHGALLEIQDNSHNTALHLAVKGKHFDAVQILLENGADANAINSRGETPLGIAISKCSIEVQVNVASNQEHEIILLLLSYGANVHGPCNTCPSALCCALLYNKRYIAQLLLEEYAGIEDLHCVDEDGSGLLHYLAYLIDDNAGPLMDQLLEFASDLNVQNVDGDTPLHAAAIRSNLMLARKLVGRKAIAGVLNRKGHTPLDFARNLRFRVVVLEECLREASKKKRKK